MMRVITKKVWDKKEWCDGIFYELPKTHQCIDWLKTHYGYPEYSVSWWKTVDSVWVRDKIYIHWKLIE